MKKNRMMRLASGLLVAVLMTTSVISGTFAKYVTTASASDTARVAKFGVVVTAEGSLFGETYLKTNADTPGADDADKATITVESSNENKVVAPGTKNDEGITATITGTPEVDVDVSVVVKGLSLDGTTEYDDVKEIFLAAGNGYPDMTTGNSTDTFNTTEYYPVKFTLTQIKNGTTTVLVQAGKLSAVEAALESLSTTYKANANLANEVGTLNLTWEWDFDASGAGTYDKQDTLLGDLAAETTLTPALPDGASYGLETGIKIDITVTQID